MSPAKKSPAARRKPSAAKRPAKTTKKTAKKGFGRSGTAGKAQGDAAARQWIAGIKRAHRPIVDRIDQLVAQTVPDVQRAIKWSNLMYGRPGHGFFAAVGAYTNHLNLMFFAGAQLKPQPPEGEGKGMRRLKVTSVADLEKAPVRSWFQQASALKGWGTV